MSLYACCQAVLPEPEADGAVLDTFLIATVKRVAAMPGRVTVAPVGRSLPAGAHVDVTVTVTSKAGLTTHIVVQPGNLTVTVVYKVKPQPAPKPQPTPKPPPPSKG